MGDLRFEITKMNSEFELTAVPPGNIASLTEISKVLTAPNAGLTDTEGNTSPIPQELLSVLRFVVETFKSGKAVHLQTLSETLTTGEAASLLNVSRPTLVKLLEAGKIPYTQPNRHRYVQLNDLIKYQKQIAELTRSTLDALSKDALADGLHELTLEDAEKALRKIRKG